MLLSDATIIRQPPYHYHFIATAILITAIDHVRTDRMSSEEGYSPIRNIFYRISGAISKSYTRFERFVTFSKHPLLTVIIAGLILRIALIPFSFNADMKFWGWIVDIIDNDYGLYSTEGYYYTPVWGYVLGVSSFLGKLLGITDYGALIPAFVPYMSESYTVYEYVMSIGFSFVAKAPLIAADVVTALLLHRFVKSVTGNDAKAVMSAALWLLCPLVLMETGIHGMPDNLSAMFLLLTIMLTYERKYFSAGIALSFAMLVKIFPICFVFLLTVWIFKKEGWNVNGLKKIGMAVLGSVIGFVVLNIPSIISNNIWETMRFFTDRIGISTARINELLPLSHIALILLILFTVSAIMFILLRERISELKEKIRMMDSKKRDKLAIHLTVAFTFILMIAVAVYSVITVSRMGNADLPRYLESIAMKIMIIIALISVSLSIFIAYRFAFSGELKDDKLFTALMLTSSFLFIWMPLPQYPIAILPLMIIYVVAVDRRFFIPFIMFTVCMTLYETAMGGITALFSVASFTSLIDINLVTSFLDFYTNKSFFIEPSTLFIVLFGAIAYISMIYIPFKWLREHNWGRIE